MNLLKRDWRSEHNFCSIYKFLNTLNLYRVGKNHPLSDLESPPNSLTVHNYRIRSFSTDPEVVTHFLKDRVGIAEEDECTVIYSLEINAPDKIFHCPEWLMPLKDSMYKEEEWIITPGKIFEIKSIDPGFPEKIKNDCEKWALGYKTNFLRTIPKIFTINIGIQDKNKTKSVQMGSKFVSNLD